SLPMVFGTTLANLPNEVPYLVPPPERVDYWRSRLARDRAARLRVGLSWAGSPKNPRDRYRSMSLAALAPLAGIEGVAYYSLQKGEPAAQLADARAAGLRVIDHTAELSDFAETAALMANLDLVISVDTAVAHLAGACARPTWLMLSAGGEWRWMMGREDS